MAQALCWRPLSVGSRSSLCFPARRASSKRPITCSTASTISIETLETGNRMQADMKDAILMESNSSRPPQLPGTVIFPAVHVEGRRRSANERRPQGVVAGGSGLPLQHLSPEGSVRTPYKPSPEAAWEYFRSLGSPKLHVAPMVDASELPFRMLCRRWGAEAAYSPMIHSRLFLESGPKHRHEHFTTCPEDRPLFVQFCANDPDTLLGAAKLVEHQCDYVDLNLGCPQRIAKRGYYGAFLMDNLPLVRSLVATLTSNLAVPVSCKIRIFPNLEDTLTYARMLQDAGCALVAVHGRTRDQKCGKLRADWDAIRAVKQALRIPVLANGNVRWLEDAEECMRYTGADGVLSAETLLSNPALFSGHRMPGDRHALKEESQQHPPTETNTRSSTPNTATDSTSPESMAIGRSTPSNASGMQAAASISLDLAEGARNSRDGSGALVDWPCPEPEGVVSGEVVGQRVVWRGGTPDPTSLMLEYLDLCETYPVPMRMVRGHVHRMLGGWFRLHTDLRNRLNREYKLTLGFARELVHEIRRRKEADPTLVPLPEAADDGRKERGDGGSARGEGLVGPDGVGGEKRVEVGVEVVSAAEGDEKRVKIDVQVVGGGSDSNKGSGVRAGVSLAS